MWQNGWVAPSIAEYVRKIFAGLAVLAKAAKSAAKSAWVLHCASSWSQKGSKRAMTLGRSLVFLTPSAYPNWPFARTAAGAVMAAAATSVEKRMLKSCESDPSGKKNVYERVLDKAQ